MRNAVDHQRNIDGELAIAPKELAGSIQRIHQNHSLTANGNFPARGGLFRHYRDTWHPLGQSIKYDCLGLLIGVAHRAVIRLGALIAFAVVNFHDGQARFNGKSGENFRNGVET